MWRSFIPRPEAGATINNGGDGGSSNRPGAELSPSCFRKAATLHMTCMVCGCSLPLFLCSGQMMTTMTSCPPHITSTVWVHPGLLGCWLLGGRKRHCDKHFASTASGYPRPTSLVSWSADHDNGCHHLRHKSGICMRQGHSTSPARTLVGVTATTGLLI